VTRPPYRLGDAWTALRNDDAAQKSTLAVVMALVTFFAAAVAYLQQDSSIEAGVAQRESEAIATTAVGDQVASLTRTSSDLGAFRQWYETSVAAGWATRLEAEIAPSHYDDALLGGLATAETDVATWAAGQSALLQPPYYDSTTKLTDYAGYIADTQVTPLIRSTLRSEVLLSVGAQWGSRSGGYVTILTLLAVSLFFFGLATTLTPRTRGLFAGTGAAFVLLAVVWTGALATSSIKRVPDDVLESVVTARSEQAHVANASAVGPMVASDRAHFEAGLAAADRALAAMPDYGAARLARAEIGVLYADGLFFRSDDPDRMRAVLAQSQDDYHRYIAGPGGGDYSAWWNLGWAQVLSRDPAAALASTEQAVKLAPTHFALYLNRALAHLEAGDLAGAAADTHRSLEVARDSGLDSNGQFFLQAEFNIDRLATLWPDLRASLTTMSRTLREGQVSLQVLHQARPADDPATIDATLPVRLTLRPDGAFVPELFDESFAFASGGSFKRSDANGVRIFIASGVIKPGTMVSVRVWHDGRIDASGSADKPWAPVQAGDLRYMAFDVLSPYGKAGSPMEIGAYHLEVYLDGNTGSQLDWTVTP
jgi:tetratricopeptide (TPR) repeat protein